MLFGLNKDGNHLQARGRYIKWNKWATEGQISHALSHINIKLKEAENDCHQKLKGKGEGAGQRPRNFNEEEW
jgi:hypothetical protein